MQRCPAMLRSFATVAVSLAAATANAASDCSKQIAIIDERLAAADYPDTHVQMALQMRGAIEQMCGVMDEPTLNAMLEGLDDLLPVKPDEQLQAERRAKSEELKAAREAGKQRAASQPAAHTHPVLAAPPTARSVAARFIERVDDMSVLWIWDWDIAGETTRVLYTTSPSLPQLARPDWQQYVYVVELMHDGSARQHAVTSRHASDRVAIALRRGHDEIVLQRHADEPGGPTQLERWSISGRRLLATAPTPAPPGADGEVWDWGPLRLGTSDGNVLFVQTRATDDRGSMIGWFEASPDGRVLGQGLATSPRHALGATGWFATMNGGGGIVVSITATDDGGIASAIPTPIARELNGTKLELQIGREMRLLVTSDDARTAWESPAIERDILWPGAAGLSPGLSAAAAMQQQHALTGLMSSVAIELDANRTVGSIDIGPHYAMMIKPMRTGHGVLVTVTADRKRQPPVHGTHLLTVGDDGVRKAAYLNPMAEALGVDFTALAIAANDDTYLYGNALGRGKDIISRVVRLDRDGDPTAHGASSLRSSSRVAIVGLSADASGVWLIGRGGPGDSRTRLWVERIAFP